jgi:hypothetical protein
MPFFDFLIRLGAALLMGAIVGPGTAVAPANGGTEPTHLSRRLRRRS